jgi:acyl-coenzyme A thioesterase PaaI-like protein
VADETVPAPPEGYTPSTGRGAFTTHNGPYFNGPSDETISRQAFFVLGRHCNGVGILHGGMISAFLDGLLAGAAARGSGLTPITMHLSVDFLDMGKKGDWVMAEAWATKVASANAFVSGVARVGNRDIARVNGVFRLLRRRD